MTKNQSKYFDTKSLIVVTCSALLGAVSPVHANPTNVSVLTSNSPSSRINSEYSSLTHPVVMLQADTVAQGAPQKKSSAENISECDTGNLSCTAQNAFTNAFRVVPLHECWTEPSRSACARAAMLLGIENPSARILTSASFQIAEQLDDEIEKLQEENKAARRKAQELERKARHRQRMEVLEFFHGTIMQGIDDLDKSKREKDRLWEDFYRRYPAARPKRRK